MNDERIAEIRARHQEGIRSGADADRAYLLAEVDRLTRERDEARAEVERLRATLQGAALAAHGCAQCRDEIGRICREALEAKP